MFFYSDRSEPLTHQIAYHRQNANKRYLFHFENYMFLNFIVQKSDKKSERDQALKELTICERKMGYWRRHVNFDQQIVANECARIKQNWAKK